MWINNRKFASDNFTQGFVHTIECFKVWRRLILNTDRKYKLLFHFSMMLNNQRTVIIEPNSWKRFIVQLTFCRNDIEVF